MAGAPFLQSANVWDWLGLGVYFWEYAPNRAWEWAEENAGKQPAVIQARIELGKCLNFLDTKDFDAIREVFQQVKRDAAEKGQRLPKNYLNGAHHLDQQIVNLYCRLHEEETGRPYQTVRACFPEGEPVFEGSALLAKTHVQLAVRDLSCISDLHLV